MELDNRIPIPQNAVTVSPLQLIHLDEELYLNAYEFNPFRFMRSDSLHNVFSSIISRHDPSRKPKPKSSVKLDESFLGFGFGKHACPGRFFALNEIKLFVAYLVRHYGIEHVKE